MHRAEQTDQQRRAELEQRLGCTVGEWHTIADMHRAATKKPGNRPEPAHTRT